MNDDLKPWPIKDTPNTHGMFMLGTTTLYLCHMPMFDKEDHLYQMTLQIRLDPTSMSTYLADKAQHPGSAYNLTNLESGAFTLPQVACGQIRQYVAAIYRDYSNDGGGTPSTPIVDEATVFVDRVVVYRAFDQGIPRPANLTYVLFGDGKEAHLDHYIALDPDFQHLMTLPAVPDWLDVTQLQAGVLVSFPQPSAPIGCTSPVAPGVHTVYFQGLANAAVPLTVGNTFWYSTGNMLNAVDPCGAPHAAPSVRSSEVAQ
ncbi:hypothetical protein BLA18110_01723 [Burkholderia lata]|uniref:hypothetical protein n=1 Tax=Burkholderia lata (strain ATCC 17760 / DSM 23089 / LMG 22485 / NCIMB 9086 / R18194 / 383) TaxID=482957 RepID=UPI001453839F|nr:hypothetical protein [Burkholderia lata]VWC67594.1 hypothetical protein BLA18110_01723 [Burkholderia lata]